MNLIITGLLFNFLIICLFCHKNFHSLTKMCVTAWNVSKEKYLVKEKEVYAFEKILLRYNCILAASQHLLYT